MLQRRTKTIAAVAALAFVVSAGIFGGLWYLVAQKQAAFHAQVYARAEALATNRQLSALVGLVEETRTQRTELESYVLPENGVVAFLEEIEALATEQNMALETESIAVSEGEAEDVFEQLTLTVSVQGSYAQISRMLRLFELLPYQVVVRSVAFDRTGGALGAWTGTFDLVVTKAKAL